MRSWWPWLPTVIQSSTDALLSYLRNQDCLLTFATNSLVLDTHFCLLVFSLQYLSQYIFNGFPEVLWPHMRFTGFIFTTEGLSMGKNTKNPISSHQRFELGLTLTTFTVLPALSSLTCNPQTSSLLARILRYTVPVLNYASNMHTFERNIKFITISTCSTQLLQSYYVLYCIVTL